jgi:hypothetical protein
VFVIQGRRPLLNAQNYATLEPCKRLVEAGIVLETEAAWCEYKNGDGRATWGLGNKELIADDPRKRIWIPAPSMAEVWRELPDELEVNGETSHKVMWCEGNNNHYCAYMRQFKVRSRYFTNINPTDALIDLLIFTRKQTEGGGE